MPTQETLLALRGMCVTCTCPGKVAVGIAIMFAFVIVVGALYTVVQLNRK